HELFGGGITFGPARHVELTKEHHSFAFAIFHQRAVLKAEAAIENRQEITARGFFDQHRRHISAIAATPHPRHWYARPLDGRPVARTYFILQSRWKDRR